MTTGPDLINIENLGLSDTFNTWFVRTNQIIDNLNPLQIYDVYAGTTSGLSITGSGSSGGIASFFINTGPGVGIGPTGIAYYNNKVIVDFADFEPNGLTLSTNPTVSDEYIVNDVSDTTLGAQGTPKKITANKILPSVIDMDGTLSVNSSLVTFSDDVRIQGDLVVVGENSYIASNDLRIEDRQIELAYQLAGYAGITGVTAGTYTTGLSGVGVGYTAYYANAGGTADFNNAIVIGYTKSFTGSSAGPTATVRIGSIFLRGGPANFNVGGFFAFDVPGLSGATFPVVAISGTGDFEVPCIETDFLCDAYLDEAGIVVKGATGDGCGDGDKSFLWYTDDNAWRSNVNLGVDADYAVISSKFKSGQDYGAANREGIFEFVANGEDTNIQLSQFDGTASWQISKTEEVSSPNNSTLVFSFDATGSGYETKFTITPGPSGQTFPGVTTTSFARSFNADMLDGAHGYTSPTPFGIPIADGSGLIDSAWVKTDRITKSFTQSGHDFTVGTVIRYDVGSNTYQRAYADNAEAAETIGVVEAVDGDTFTVNMQGFITGLSLSTTGTVYFLAPQSASGGLITNPSFLSNTDVRKAIIYSLSTTTGIVLGHPGIINDDPTDTVYLNNAIPVGSIYPYAGTINIEGLQRQGWIVCDGKRYYASDWDQLHSSIGQKYYADGTVVSADGETVEISFSGGDTLGFLGGTGSTGESVYIETAGGTGFDNYKFLPISPGDTAVTVHGLTTGPDPDTEIASGASVRVYGRNQGLSTIFLVPDLRRRVTVGASVGDGLTGTASPSLERGDVGGVASYGTTELGVDSGLGNTVDYTILDLTGLTSMDNMQPYATVNYLIRAKNAYDAIIITGHNHDFRYIRFDGIHDEANGAGYDLTDSDRAQFRSNAKVLRSDGDDTMRGSLNITGSLFVQGDMSLTGESFYRGTANHYNTVNLIGVPFGVEGNTDLRITNSFNEFADENWNDFTPDLTSTSSGNGWVGSGDSYWSKSGLKIRGGNLPTASMILWNDNANAIVEGDSSYSDGCKILFFGVGTTNPDSSRWAPRFMGSVTARVADKGGASGFDRAIALTLGGTITGGAASPAGDTTVFEISRSGSFRLDNTTTGDTTVTFPRNLRQLTDAQLNSQGARQVFILPSGELVARNAPGV